MPPAHALHTTHQHKLTHQPSHSLSHTHARSYSHVRHPQHSPAHSRTHTHTRTPHTHSLTHSHIPAHTHSHNSLSHTHSLTLSLTHPCKPYTSSPLPDPCIWTIHTCHLGNSLFSSRRCLMISVEENELNPVALGGQTLTRWSAGSGPF